jgi:hypothetical protein
VEEHEETEGDKVVIKRNFGSSILFYAEVILKIAAAFGEDAHKS